MASAPQAAATRGPKPGNEMIVVDRIEGDRAVLEADGRLLDFPLGALPPGTSEGDVLQISIDPDRTRKRKARGEARLARLRERTPQTKTFEL